MKVTVLGSGNNYLNPNRYASGFLIETGEQKILLECGSHISRRLMEKDMSLLDIDRIFISHSHPDHIGDLIPSLLSMYLVHHRWPSKQRTRPMFIDGYPGFTKDYNTLKDISFPERSEPYQVVVTDHADDEFQAGDIKVSTTVVPHMDQFLKTVAWRIDNGKTILAYSADCGFCPELIEISKDADIAIFEAAFTAASFEKSGPVKGHMAPQEAGQAAAQAGVKKLALHHIYDGLEDDAMILEAAHKYFDGEVVIGRDGLKL